MVRLRLRSGVEWREEESQISSTAQTQREKSRRAGSPDEREVRTEEREIGREGKLFIAGAGERAQRHGSDARTQRHQ